MLSLIRPSFCGRSLQPSHLARISKPRYCRTSAVLYRHTESRQYAAQPDGEKELVDNVMDQSRFNHLKVQQVSKEVHSQLFREALSPPQELIDLSIQHLTRHELYGKNIDNNPPISFKLPPLHGKTLDEHFHRIGVDAAEPYLSLAKEFSGSDVPPPPQDWNVGRSGWTRYADGKEEKVDFPEAEMLVLDVEVLYKVSPFAIMACAASPTAWYAWLSPWLLGECEEPRHLVPLGNPDMERIIIGHNVGYDRARLKEEYSLKQSKFGFLDTMSLHVASNGMCSRQRPTWLRHRKLEKLREQVALDNISADTLDMLEEEEEEAWVKKSSINSLKEVALFHCGIKVDKEVRDKFGILDKGEVVKQLGELLSYCAADVNITHKVYKKVLPSFLEICPHSVSFAALRHLSAVALPVNKSWETYIKSAEDTYTETSNGIQERLIQLAEKALERLVQPADTVLGEKDNPESPTGDPALGKKYNLKSYMDDPWLQQLDWGGQEVKMVKLKDGTVRERKHQRKQPGKPNWYRDLFPKAASTVPNITVRARIAPILLRLAWDKRPLVWSDKFGWVIRVPLGEEADYKGSSVVKCNIKEEKNPTLSGDTSNVYFKLPHKDGPSARCVSPLAKGYLKYFEEGILSSEYPLAKEALQMNAACSYWVSARERIKSQMVIYESDLGPGEMKYGHGARNDSMGLGLGGMEVGTEVRDDNMELGPGEMKVGPGVMNENLELGIILPQLIPMGTVTRRAVERTWLTASNAKPNRVGSELKAMVKAPPGYVFVGSDVDSQELWIASLVGDAQFKLHGGNAIGFMTLEGTKAAGTDLHSKTAKILSISRNNAKIFNYGRIYGAGVKFASTLLRQFNPGLPDAEADKISENLYKETKGEKATKRSLYDRPFWHGGTESFVFNKLEEFANQDLPRTPVLGAGITEALRREYLSVNVFMPSRINWAIQSSGVDYLHLLIISMDHLIRRFELDARLAITVHDEIRYMVKEEHKYRVAMALQIANLWTRAMFSQQMGIEDLPQSCAYFSAVDIDCVLRKEVDMDCITPSQPERIPPGESINMTELLKILEGKDPEFMQNINATKDTDDRFSEILYTERVPVMEQLQKKPNILFLRAQSADSTELREILQGLKKEKEPNAFSRSQNRQVTTLWGASPYPRQNQDPHNVPAPKGQKDMVSKTPRSRDQISNSPIPPGVQTDTPSVQKQPRDKRYTIAAMQNLGLQWTPISPTTPSKVRMTPTQDSLTHSQVKENISAAKKCLRGQEVSFKVVKTRSTGKVV